LQIEDGDILGIAWVEKKIIPFDYKKCEAADSQPYLSDVYLFRQNPLPPLVVGKAYIFKRADINWGPCRKYSVMAHIQSKCDPLCIHLYDYLEFL